MKKIFATLLSLTLLMSSSAIAITQPANNTADVTATYVSNNSGVVYSVDITWGSLDFTYTAPSKGIWDPVSHTYSGSESAGTWSCDADENKITVINHSNTAVTASMNFEAVEGYSDITGSFDNAAFDLATAEGTEAAAAPKGSSSLTLNGELPSSHSNKSAVGTVTVTISDSGSNSIIDSPTEGEPTDRTPVITSMSTENTEVNTTTPLVIKVDGENLDKITDSDYPEVSLVIGIPKKVNFLSEYVTYDVISPTSAAIKITLPYFELNQSAPSKTITQIKYVYGGYEGIASMTGSSIIVTE